MYIYKNKEYLACTKWNFVDFNDFLNSVQFVKSDLYEKKLIKFADLKQKKQLELKKNDNKFFVIDETLNIKQLM